MPIVLPEPTDDANHLTHCAAISKTEFAAKTASLPRAATEFAAKTATPLPTDRDKTEIAAKTATQNAPSPCRRER